MFQQKHSASPERIGPLSGEAVLCSGEGTSNLVPEIPGCERRKIVYGHQRLIVPITKSVTMASGSSVKI